MTVAELLDGIDSRCSAAPQARAISQPGGRCLSYGELGRELGALTAGLRLAGLRPGDAVVFSIRPCPEAVLLILAIARCGGVMVAAEPGMAPDLFASRMSALSPRWVMAESALYALTRITPVRAFLERRGVMLPNLDIKDARVVLSGHWLPWPRSMSYVRLAHEPREAESPPVDPTRPLAVIFTSGTTAAPKGVVHTGESIGASLAMIADRVRLTPADRVYSDQLHMIVPALVAGAEAVLPRRRTNPRLELSDLAAIRPTHAFWVPSHVEELLGRLPDSLRVVILGSAPSPPTFLRRLAAALSERTRVYSAYAMTEALPVSWVSLEDKLAHLGDGDLAGEPCPGVHIRIAADGEILVSGPNLCRGYLGMPPATEVATGDIGRLDGGRLVLLGRKKDMIIRGSYNIYPALVEDTVAAVRGVRRCALIGLYDDRRADEEVVLAVEPQDGADRAELRRRVKREIFEGPRRIDIYARPDRIVFTRIPLAGRSHKPDKIALRKLVMELIRC